MCVYIYLCIQAEVQRDVVGAAAAAGFAHGSNPPPLALALAPSLPDSHTVLEASL